MPAPSNLITELATINEYWSPQVIGQINDHYLKVAKVLGDLVWHKHDDEDELFCVVKGRLVIEFEDDKVTFDEGDFPSRPSVIPKRNDEGSRPAPRPGSLPRVILSEAEGSLISPMPRATPP
jgi:hypothetical protein